MPILTGGGFIAATGDPIDNRIVGTTSVLLSNLEYSYDGLNCYLTDLKKLYSFNQSKYNLFISGGGTPSLSNVFQYWDIVSGGGVSQYNSIISFPNIGDPSILYVDQSSKLSYYWSTQSSTYSCTVDIFTYNPTVYLGPTYSFGKYTNGQTILAIGKTPQQVILDAISQPLAPTVEISIVPTTVPYNSSSIVATISVSYTINSAGATSASGTVSYGTITPNNFLINKVGPTSSYTNTFTQSITYSTLPINSNTTNIYYKYDVTDTQGAESISNAVITMNGYSLPTLSLSATRTNPQTGETDINREIGNIGTTLSSSVITITSPLVPLLYYQLSYNNNGGSYNNIGSTISINSGSSITTTFSNVISNTSSTATFRLTVTDLKQSNSITTNTINFYYPYYYYRSTTLYSSSQIASWISVGGTVSKIIANTSGSISITAFNSPNNEYLYIIFPRSLSTWANPLLSSDTGQMSGNDGSYYLTTTSITPVSNYWTNTYYIYISKTAITKTDATSGYNYN